MCILNILHNILYDFNSFSYYFDTVLFRNPYNKKRIGQLRPMRIKPVFYLNIFSISSWQMGLIPFWVRTLIALSLSSTRRIMNALFAFLARNA